MKTNFQIAFISSEIKNRRQILPSEILKSVWTSCLLRDPVQLYFIPAVGEGPVHTLRSCGIWIRDRREPCVFIRSHDCSWETLQDLRVWRSGSLVCAQICSCCRVYRNRSLSRLPDIRVRSLKWTSGAKSQIWGDVKEKMNMWSFSQMWINIMRMLMLQ